MAQLLTWTPDLSVGIDIIDKQHMRIVEYINQLHEARIRQDKEAISSFRIGCAAANCAGWV